MLISPVPFLLLIYFSHVRLWSSISVRPCLFLLSMCSKTFCLGFFLFVCFRERGMRGEREERNIHQFPHTCAQRGTEPTTQAYALTGNQTRDLSLCEMTPKTLSHTGQGSKRPLKGSLFILNTFSGP